MARPREFDREEILGRALQIFWSNGYKNTSMEKLVSKLGVNRASVYNTFGSKREFFAAALNHYMHTRLPEMLAALRADGPADHRLQKFFDALIFLGGKQNDYRGCFVIGSMSELASIEPDLFRLCVETVNALEKEIGRVVKQGQARGEIRNDLSAADLTTLLVSSAIGLMTKARTKESPRKLKTATISSLRMLRPQLQ